MDYYCNINNNEIKYLQNENLKEYLDGGPIICSSYFTYRCPMDSDDEANNSAIFGFEIMIWRHSKAIRLLQDMFS